MQVVVMLRDGQNNRIDSRNIESTLLPNRGEILVWGNRDGSRKRYTVWEREFWHEASDIPRVILRVDVMADESN